MVQACGPHPAARPRPFSLTLLAFLAGLVAARGLAAQDRLVRHFGAEDGLEVPAVAVLAQDSLGFLWIGGEGGLFRYDGAEVRRWAPDVVPEPIVSAAVSPRGRVVVHDRRGSLFVVTTDGVRALEGPGPSAPPRQGSLAFDRDGGLWTVSGGTLARRGTGGSWQLIPARTLEGEVPRVVTAGPRRAIHVGTDAGVWRVESTLRATRLLKLEPVADLVVDGDRVLALTGAGRVLEIRGGESRILFPVQGTDPPPGRPITLTVRGETVWVSFDRFLLAIHPDEVPEVLGPADGIRGGGPLLVDHEGSLWLGTFSGVSQYPEPDTRIWGDRHGLPSQHTRYVVRAGEDVWVTTWQGAAVLRREPAGWRAEAVGGLVQGRPCPDGRGGVFLGEHDALLEVARTLSVRRHPGVAGLLACVGDASTGLWLATMQGLLYLAPGAPAPRPVLHPPVGAADAAFPALLLDSRDRLWVGGGHRICHAAAGPLRAGAPPQWDCDSVPEALEFRDLVELPGGSIWAATYRGVFAYDGQWAPIPGSAALPSRTLFRLVPSRSGGLWVLGHGTAQRVLERPALTAGWEVLERLSAWHGLPGGGAQDLLEDEDGTLWLTTSRGLVRVPAAARYSRPSPPRVLAVEARADDQVLALDSAHLLPHRRNRLDLRFAALSFRDRSRLRTHFRLSSAAPWSEVAGGTTLQWVDLPPGSYTAEFRSSLDGVTWSPEPYRFQFSVLPPWYGTAGAMGFFALTAAALAFLAYRTRVGFLLRLERQRTRIAMDLHDELGAGLGSIGILSGVLAREGMDEHERRSTAQEIASAAESLGAALSNIVWSLDPRTATLHDLAARLAEHGQRLFADGTVGFSMHLPTEWPQATLSAPVRRNLLLIGLEALHNVARHAHARRVRMTLTPRDGEWELRVRDDGVGLPDPSQLAGAAGMGLRSIERRAREIGGRAYWRCGRGSGTDVIVRFPFPRPHRLGVRLRRPAIGGASRQGGS